MASARLESWADHLSGSVAGLQRQFDAEKRATDRRFQQLERQLQSAVGRIEGGGDYHFRDGGGQREKWAELQGSVTGLMEEVQALARRADGVDDRLWARASGAEELARQGARELQQQVQSLERQHRLQTAAAEDAQRRQQSRQRRFEKLFEDLEWRLGKIEEERRPDQDEGPSAMEEQMQGVFAEFESVRARIAAVEALHAKPSDMAVGHSLGPGDSRLNVTDAGDVQASLGALEARLASLESKASAQFEEMRSSMATVRVKVEGQYQRQGAIAERLEMAHIPTLEALRGEVATERARDLRAVEDRIAEVNQKVECLLEATETSHAVDNADTLNNRTSAVEALAGALRREVQDLRTGLRAEIRAVQGRSSGGGRSGGPGGGAPSGGGRPPLPGGASGVASLAEPTIREQLGAVADQLEALDELADRLGLLESRVARLEQQRDGRPGEGAAPPAPTGGAPHWAGGGGAPAEPLPISKEWPQESGLRSEGSRPRGDGPVGAAFGRPRPSCDEQPAGAHGGPVLAALQVAREPRPGPEPTISVEPPAPERPAPAPQAAAVAPAPWGAAASAGEDGKGHRETSLAVPGPAISVGSGAGASGAGDSSTGGQSPRRTPPLSPATRPPACPWAQQQLQRSRLDHGVQPERLPESRRMSSFDSLRSSIDIAMSPDESVDDTFVLQHKCDLFEDVIRPSDGGPEGFEPVPVGAGEQRLLAAHERAAFAQGSDGSDGYEPGALDDDAFSLDESVCDSGDERTSN